MNACKRFPLIAFLALAALYAGVNQGSAGEQRFQPGITVSEEYNDNILLVPRSEDQMTDYITRILPSVHYIYTAAIWEWDLVYAYDYRYYSKGTKENDSTHSLDLSNHTSLVREFVFIDVKDVYRRVSIDTTEDYTAQSLFLNQTDMNDFILTPYARFHVTSKTTGTAGYQYRNVWYKQRFAQNKSEHAVFADVVDELSEKTSLTAGARIAGVNAETRNYSRIGVYAGPRHEYAEGSELWLIIGGSWIDLEHGTGSNQLSWDTGISHSFVTYRVSLNATMSYIDDPNRVERREDRYVATLRKDTDRFSLELLTGRWEYRNIRTKRLENTRHTAGGSVSYQFTSALRGLYSLSIDRYDDERMRTYSMLYLNAARFEYVFPANSMLAFEYRFLHGYSPDAVNYLMNYDNNRVIAEFRTFF